MNSNSESTGDFADGMSEYLQTFLDETEEQLDDLVETMLSLETTSTNEDDLNEAFRLIHSIKGSAGMMGLDNITVLTHHLENRFERFRSGTEQLDETTMNLVLRCIDFLRQCNGRLRNGEKLGSPTELLDDLKRLEERSAASHANTEDEPASHVTNQPSVPPKDHPDSLPFNQTEDDSIVRMVIHFRTGLQLADLKAQLIVNRLASFGELKATHPNLDALPEDEQLEQFTIDLQTDTDLDGLRAAADVDGVESIVFLGAASEAAREIQTVEPTAQDSIEVDQTEPAAADSPPQESGLADPETATPPPEPLAASTSYPTEPSETGEAVEFPRQIDSESPAEIAAPVKSPRPDKAAAKVAETMRVDIDRLDNLMNLAGELVVNRARFVQISDQISPSQRKPSASNRIREFCETLRETIDGLQDETVDPDQRTALVQRLRFGLELMDEHSQTWEHDRRYLEKFGDAIDQLSRVSYSLQKGVLDTRMVPVGPMFNRFKRVTRDLSKERGKQVNLLVRGEQTELDKRMIDGLGDPLIHLVRNSIDHGLESPETRIASGKPEVGTILLEADHRGNNVYIHVRDDGRGIDIEKIKHKLISNQIVSESVARELSDEQALDYIWHPGFSTANKITDVSGRGVGMDVVQDRIKQLNGSVEIKSIPQQGTHFTIRLPLTLAIINCLLVKLRGVVFSMPIGDVREIVSVDIENVIKVQGKQTIDVRDEFISLVSINEIFDWHNVDYGHRVDGAANPESENQTIDVVLLQTAGKTLGLRVNEFLGSQDMVIKSLSDNFIDIRGLSGASILGDGSVCLMLDVATLSQMATQAPLRTKPEELST